MKETIKITRQVRENDCAPVAVRNLYRQMKTTPPLLKYLRRKLKTGKNKGTMTKDLIDYFVAKDFILETDDKFSLATINSLVKDGYFLMFIIDYPNESMAHLTTLFRVSQKGLILTNTRKHSFKINQLQKKCFVPFSYIDSHLIYLIAVKKK